MTSTPTLQNLPENVYAKVYHFDSNKLKQQMNYFPNLRSFVERKTKYLTVCYLHDTQTREVVSVGTSACNPNDTPSRKLGYAIARNRAVLNLKLVNEDLHLLAEGVFENPENYPEFFENMDNGVRNFILDGIKLSKGKISGVY